MVTAISSSFIIVMLWHASHSALASEAQLLNPIQPSYKILSSWRAHKIWEESHDMEVAEEFLSNAYRNLISNALMEKEQNTSDCTRSLTDLGLDLGRRQMYALQAVDAAGKLPSGISQGNIKWNGRYYVCLKAKSEKFSPKWCSLTVGEQTIVGVTGSSVGMSIGMCLPDSCSEDMITKRLEVISNKVNQTFAVHCPIQPTVWTDVDILSITVFGVLLALVILGTLIDYCHGCKKDGEAKALSINANDISNHVDVSEPRQKSVFTEIILCFSAIKNTNALLDTSTKSGTIACLHGIRFLSITWVVLCHTYLMTLIYSANFKDMTDWFFDAFSFQAVANGFFGVDSFFFLSGLLVTFLCLKESSNFHGRQVPMFYLQRYLRLTPTLAFLILFIVGFYGKLGDGPMWPDSYASGKNICAEYWWTNILYINNLHPSQLTGECVAWSWYLANDMQFFLLAPISILLLKWKPKVGVNLLAFGIFSSVLVTGIISSHFKEQPENVGIAILLKTLITNVSFPPPQPGSPHNGSAEVGEVGLPPMNPKDAFWSDLYTKPWCRIGIYLVGMLTGYFLHATKMKIKMTKIFAAFGWVVATALNLSLVYGLWWYCKEGKPLDISLAAFYNAVSRPMWGVGLSWLVIACACGYGGPINAFLSWKLFIPFSRLTFCIYLIHPQIIVWWHSTQEVTSYYSNVQYAFYFAGALTVAIGAAYVLSILVELPFLNMGKLLLKKREPGRSVQNDEQLLVAEQSPEDGEN